MNTSKREEPKARGITKTFQKEDQLHEVIDWFVNQIETHDWQPAGTNWGGGEPGPMDPRCDLAHKYTITITRKPTPPKQ